MSIARRTDRMDITVATTDDDRYVFVQQKWLYSWNNLATSTPWTHSERQRFHHQVDRLIWGGWSGRYVVKVNGTSAFARNHASDSFRINFDVRWVLRDPHWNVAVTKIPAGQFQRSSVNWGGRRITLDSEDIAARNIRGGGVTYRQFPLRHEFGHAVGNSVHAYPEGHGDEYRTASPHVDDHASMMNIGNQLRQRHADYLIRELNVMVPNTTFYLHRVR